MTSSNSHTPPPPYAGSNGQRRKGDLIRSDEISRVLDVLISKGVPIGAVDIRRDGLTVHPPEAKPGNDFDRWMAEDKVRDRSAHRQ